MSQQAALQYLERSKQVVDRLSAGHGESDYEIAILISTPIIDCRTEGGRQLHPSIILPVDHICRKGLHIIESENQLA